MIVFTYDNTFDGLLSCVFFAYEQRKFPDLILSEFEQKPLFINERYYVDSVVIPANSGSIIIRPQYSHTIIFFPILISICF